MKLKDVDIENLYVSTCVRDECTCYLLVDDGQHACAWKMELERFDGSDDAFDVSTHLDMCLIDELTEYAESNPDEEVKSIIQFVGETLMDENTSWCDCMMTLERI